MKIVFDPTYIAPHMNFIKHNLDWNPPILKAIRFDVGEFIEATVNLSGVTIITRIPGEIKEQGTCIVPYNLLSVFFKNINNNEDVFLTEENGKIDIYNSKNNLSSFIDTYIEYKLEDYPETIERDQTYTPYFGIHTRRLNYVAYATIPQGIPSCVQGVYFESKDGALVLKATNGHMASTYKLQTSFKEKPLFVHCKVIDLLLDFGGYINVGVNGSIHEFLVDDHTRIYTQQPILDKDYPDFDVITPKNTSKTVVMSKSDLLSICKDKGFQKKKSQAWAHFIFNKNGNDVEVTRLKDKCEGTRYTRTIQCEYADDCADAMKEGFAVGFSLDYLYDIVSRISSDKVTILGTNNLDPFVINYDSGRGQVVLMPTQV